MASDDERERDDKRHAKRWERRVKMRQKLSEKDDSRSRVRLLEEDEESQSMLTMLKVICVLVVHKSSVDAATSALQCCLSCSVVFFSPVVAAHSICRR